MADEGFEEWDADFLDQLIQAEESALSSTQQQPPPSQLQPLVPPAPLQTHSVPFYGRSHGGEVSYSPPRLLSQRVNDSDSRGFDHSSFNGIGSNIFGSDVAPFPRSRTSEDKKEQEIDRLNKELGRVSKRLSHLEKECLDIREQRDEKEEQLRTVYSRIEADYAEMHHPKYADLEYDHTKNILGHHNVNQLRSRINTGVVPCKAIGVQTDDAASYSTTKNDLSHLQSKLLSVWDSSSGQKWGRYLISKLFVTCETDFRVLFGYLNLNLPLKLSRDIPTEKHTSDVTLHGSPQPAEGAKLSHLYSILIKISNGMALLNALLDALLDLCGLENVVIVYSSMRVLCVVLNELFNMERGPSRRDNVIVEVPSSSNGIADKYGPEFTEFGRLFCAKDDDSSDLFSIPFETTFFSSENHDSTLPKSSVDWVSLFELMCQIAMRNNEEHIRLQAASIMNMIVMRTNPYSEREKFGQEVAFQIVSELLRKKAGVQVQKQAVHLLFLLLNCPKLVVMFCSGCEEEGENTEAVGSDVKDASAFQGFGAVLDALADCVTLQGNGTLELKLCRDAINVLAFLSASGKSGVEILLSHQLPSRINFLALILQMLISQLDVEASACTHAPDIFKERTLLIREALILLNRLVSNPLYSVAVLHVLTSNRDVASMTVDAANRLSRKGEWLWQSDSMIRHMRESEVVELSRVLRKRVFGFLGESIS